MKVLSLICPECGGKLEKSGSHISCENKHNFNISNRVCNLLPSSMSGLTKKDALYHENLIGDWENQAQTGVFRNVYFHKEIAEFIFERSNNDSNILELAGGAGYDLRLFMSLNPDFCNYIFSEISGNMAEYAAGHTEDKRIQFFCIDAHNIPFADNQFDFIYTMSAFHHFNDMDKALKELIRVTKKQGYIIFGIEPNRFWFNLISRARGAVRKILPKKSHSSADDATEGFFLEELEALAGDYNLKLVCIEPVWFLCGFIHFGLDFLSKLFRLKKRMQIPVWLEKIFVLLDNRLSGCKILRRYSWHYTVIYQR